MMLFRRIGSALLFLAVLAAPVLAGVNTGGILVIHDANLLTSATTADPICGQGTAPTGCADVDARVDGASSSGTSAIIKVFAIFPPSVSPRVMGVTWGVHYPGTVGIEKTWNCGDFELPDGDWPNNDQGNSITWDAVQTAKVIPVYVFSAYGDGTAATIDLRTNPDPLTGGVFGDDTVPSALDAIAGFGKLGLETDGTVPPCGGFEGACCNRTLATCSLKNALDCGTSDIFKGPGTTCTPYPCGTGACCIPGAPPSCQDVASPDDCVTLGGYYRGLETVCNAPYNECLPYGACCSGTNCVVTAPEGCVAPSVFISYQACTPELCVPGLGACCSQSNCSQMTEDGCTGVFWPSTSCDAQPCGNTPGACCDGGACTVTRQQQCEQDANTFFLPNVDCNPDPCTGRGACCTYDSSPARCTMTIESQCATLWKGDQTCEPNACDLLGACCVGGLCSIKQEGQCSDGLWITQIPCQPTTCTLYGACCHGGASPQLCTITTEATCDHVWVVGHSCAPDTFCDTPVQKATWGQIKNTYKAIAR
jgi:hypothetical protein